MGTKGNFFAIGKPQWERACRLELNAAVALLVMARGTGRDNATTKWSSNSIEKYTGITWRRARAAVEKLAVNQLIEQVKGGSRPTYKLTKPDHPKDWIWLPNELVTGAGNEIPPIARLRQTCEVENLQTFIDLYGEQELIGDGGIPRDLIHELFDRTKIMDMAQC